METETDFKIADDYQTDYESNHANALDEMYKHAECLAQQVEHHINRDYLTVEMDNLDAVFKVIAQIKELAYYNYKGDRVNRWNEEYEDDFEYNFKKEVKDFLADHLGYDWRTDNE